MMADFARLSFSLSDDNNNNNNNKPINSASAASSSLDDGFEDACSICLDPFTSHNPPTVTSCKHEYHLQCILEWSQRSKECPICWQLLALKDPASQELLAAVEIEKRLRSRNPSPAAFTNPRHFLEGFDIQQDSYSDDSDFDERIMQHLAAAASRARYIRRRERQRAFGLGPSQVFITSSPENVCSQQTSGDNSLTSGMPSVENLQNLPSAIPPVVNAASSTAANRDGPFKPRIIFRQLSTEAPQGQSSSETFSFSDSIKSKWLAASARYKESISKSTRGIKEKLLARNNSVKELSKGVQREMSAGIAGVARMIERLDVTSKRTAGSNPTPELAGGTSNLSLKGKGVQENLIIHNLDQKSDEVARSTSFNASSHASTNIAGKLEIPLGQGGH